MSSRFIPECAKIDAGQIKRFVNLVSTVDRLLVLTGAGISTESGIPDYRSPKIGLYERSNHRPMMHQDFMKSAASRRRYWARNFLAWPNFSKAVCNETHLTLAKWEASDRFTWLITQNVDGLHTKAGSAMLSELHGCGHRVRCMSCHSIISRQDYQISLAAANPHWTTKEGPGELKPDGDIHIEPGAEEDFKVVSCQNCGGIMKTDVIFFGDNVPLKMVETCYEKLDQSDGILVLGSSLEVMSGYRFVYYMNIQKKPIFIVNIGSTRADDLATAKIEAKASEIVKAI
ncbi:hypothetical protein WR25_03329 [Diploscapter pachys]|uniref:NAD-dependent protein deacylase n=1 Tax=Diploscapter pachys TaxID=2018661 RepID=A0A2A2L3P5_9BILA|nr:hypothetical protein WR25_03329 [Diploscapter pachys]